MNVTITDVGLLEQPHFTDLSAIRAKEIQQEFRKKFLPEGFRVDEEGVWYQEAQKNENSDPTYIPRVPAQIFGINP